MTVIAIFRSRAQALEYISFLKASGVPAQAINTPKEAGVGCGVSAKFEEGFFSRARTCLMRRHYSSFSGFMVKRTNRYVYL